MRTKQNIKLTTKPNRFSRLLRRIKKNIDIDAILAKNGFKIYDTTLDQAIQPLKVFEQRCFVLKGCNRYITRYGIDIGSMSKRDFLLEVGPCKLNAKCLHLRRLADAKYATTDAGGNIACGIQDILIYIRDRKSHRIAVVTFGQSWSCI